MAGDHSAAERFGGEREAVPAVRARRLAAVRSPAVETGRWSLAGREAAGILREPGAERRAP